MFNDDDDYDYYKESFATYAMIVLWTSVGVITFLGFMMARL